MNKDNLKYVQGRVVDGQPATICFFSEVDAWSVSDFICEFNWLTEYHKPSEIRILINSVGGSCIDGISAFSAIVNCKVPTVCVIEGIAASMASIIWAAGDKCLMRDYGLLMIHNPWAEAADKETVRVIQNFTTQLKTIYTKRFKMDEEKITAIMNGEDGFDGTYFTATQAIEAGFITDEQVIETTVANQIAAKIAGVQNCSAIASIMQCEINRITNSANHNPIIQKDDNNSKTQKTTMKQEFTVVATLLGLTEEKANEQAVIAKVQSLMNKVSDMEALEAKCKTLDENVKALNTELAGQKASVENLTQNLKAAQDALAVYQQKEEETRNAAINALVEEAIMQGKISQEAKAVWVEMAQQNLELAKNTLDSITARKDIAQHIANDPDNQKAAKDNATTEEEKVLAKVNELVGEDFKFRKITDLK